MLTTKELAKMTGATYRQIDYWCRVGLIKPIGKSNPGSGRRRLFDDDTVRKINLLVAVSHAFGGTTRLPQLEKIVSAEAAGKVYLGEGLTLSWDWVKNA